MINAILTGHIIFIAVYGVATGLLNKQRLYRFPFLASSTIIAFIVPQIIGLNISSGVPENITSRLLIVIILCQLAIFYGDYAVKNNFRQFSKWEYSYTSLTNLSLILSLIGSVFFFLISHLPEKMTSVGIWSGLPVLYLFFAQILNYGFAIAVWLTVRNSFRISLPLMVLLYDCIFYFDRIIIAGRRADTVQFILIIALALWFHKKFVPKSWMIITALVGGTLLLHSTGDYRALAKDEDYGGITHLTEINYLDNLNQLVTKGGYEIKNAAFVIDDAAINFSFDYGLEHWNGFVFAYIPAQLVGADTKKSLMLRLPKVNLSKYGFQYLSGSTFTGFSDAFRSFGYFGFIKFIIIAALMSGIYKAALNGNITMQLAYMLLVTPGMHTITHSTQNILNALPHMFVFLIIPLWFFSKKKKNQQHLIRKNNYQMNTK